MLCVQNIKNNKMVHCCLKRKAFIFLKKKKKSNSSGVGWRGVGHCGVEALFCSQAGLIQKVSAAEMAWGPASKDASISGCPETQG